MNCEDEGKPHTWMQLSAHLWQCFDCDAVTSQPCVEPPILDDEFKGCPPKPEKKE